jgi:hypothetical protein
MSWSQSVVVVTSKCHDKFLVAEKESLGNIPKCLCIVCGSVTIDSYAIGSWVKELWLSKLQVQKCSFCLTEALQSQLLALKCCNALMPSIASINVSQPNGWHPVFQSPREVLGTWSVIPKVCVRWVPGTLTLQHRTKRKPFLQFVTFWTWGRGCLSWIHAAN